MIFNFIIWLFVIGLALNLVWEFLHSRLYVTCLRQTWRENAPLLTIMAVKDAFFIVLFYSISILFINYLCGYGIWVCLVFFAILCLTFSFTDEKISLKKNRWEYAPSMPLIFGVGITPLLEVVTTGLAALGIVSYFFS